MEVIVPGRQDRFSEPQSCLQERPPHLWHRSFLSLSINLIPAQVYSCERELFVPFNEFPWFPGGFRSGNHEQLPKKTRYGYALESGIAGHDQGHHHGRRRHADRPRVYRVAVTPAWFVIT